MMTVNSSPPETRHVGRKRGLGRPHLVLAVAAGCPEARGDLLEELVAGLVAQGVVDPAEVVEVDEERRHVVVAADASDDDGVTQVRFADGGTIIGTDTDGSDGWAVSWNTTTAADGAHSVTATATDTGGQTTTSAARAVTVDNVDEPPSVALTEPAEAATVAGRSRCGRLRPTTSA